MKTYTPTEPKFPVITALEIYFEDTHAGTIRLMDADWFQFYRATNPSGTVTFSSVHPQHCVAWLRVILP